MNGNATEKDPLFADAGERVRHRLGPSSDWRGNRRIGPGEALVFLNEQLSRATAGGGRLVLISGGIASGKTQLLNEFLHYAAESDALTLSATGAPDEQRISAGIIDQLFASAVLPQEIADQVADILATGPETAGVESEICRVMLRLARERPVVIAVDDLQFVDDLSLRVLLQVQRRIRSYRVLLVLTQWNRPNTGDRRLHTSFARLPHQGVQLAPMSEQTIRELVTETLDAAVGNDLPAQLSELSAGNPMLVNALIEDYRRDNGDSNGHSGSAFSDTVLAFLHRWDAPLRDVAGALAVLGAHGTADLVARLAGVTADAAEDLMDILAGVGLLAQGGFRHPNAAAAALDSLSPTTRSELHMRAAELKHRRAAAVHEVAAHLVAAGKASGAWSVSVLREAAEYAMTADEVTFAGQCLELALSAVAEPTEHRAILETLARITWRVNPSAATSYLNALNQAESGAAAEEAASVVLVRQSLWSGDETTFTEAVDAMTAGTDGVEPRTRAEIALAYHWHFGPGSGGLDSPDVLASRHNDPWRHTAGTLAQVWLDGGSDATTACAERILRNCLLEDGTLEALVTAILALAYDNRVDRAEQWCATLSRQAARRGAVTWQALLDSVWASLILRRGDPTEAAARARSALNLLGPKSWGVAIAHPLTAMLQADTALGAFDTAAATLRHPVPETMYCTVGGLRYLRARGHYYLASDRVLAAISDFQECRRLMTRWDRYLPVIAPWRSDLAEANMRLGNFGIARELARQQLEEAAETDEYSRGLSLRILALLGPAADRQPLLAQATDLLRRSGDRLEMNRALRVPGAPQTPVRQPEAVGAPATPQPRPVRTTPPERPVAAPSATGDPADPTALSEAELRVAQLAALGKTNRQIGNSLFITVSTVEQHLTRVYRKLGIRGRSDLPVGLMANGLNASPE